MLLFHSHDETALAAWQSGLYYADGSPKTSLPAVRDALAATRGGSIGRCEGLSLTIKPRTAFSARTLGISLRCDLDCVYRARLVKLPAGTTTAATSGRAKAERASRDLAPPQGSARSVPAGGHGHAPRQPG